MDHFEPEFEPEEPYQKQRSPLRYVVYVAGLIAVGMMISIPLLRPRAVTNRQQNDRSIQTDQELVAWRFTSALLERKSTVLGKEYSSTEIHPQVESILDTLESRGFEDLSVVHALLRATRCEDFQSDQLWCFEAGVALRDGSQISIMQFSVARVKDSFLVVEIFQTGILV